LNSFSIKIVEQKLPLAEKADTITKLGHGKGEAGPHEEAWWETITSDTFSIKKMKPAQVLKIELP
jgi:hypothetical protein